MPSSSIAPGTVFVFPLENGLHGACRVVRGPSAAEATSFAGHHLVCLTPFVGQAEAALAHADTKKILKQPPPGLFWVEGAPPSTFARAGVLGDKKDAARESRQSAPWAMFPTVAFKAWRARAQPGAAAADRERAEVDAARARRDAAAGLAQRARFDLSAVVPLAKPKDEREPVEVVAGFIAAMHQWETECARIDREGSGGAAHGMMRDALAVVFAEFCTAKERKNGRGASYATPPEYDPRNEAIVGARVAGPRRAEVETRRASGLTRGPRVYVLLKTRGAWLIDSNKVRGGEPGIL